MAKVRIEIEADDQTSGAFQGLITNLEQVNEGLEGTNDRARRARSGYEEFAEGLSKSTTQLERGFSLMTRLDLVHLTLEQSAGRVAEAQDRLARATAEFGDASPQAQAAARDLEQAQASLEKANLRAELSLGLVAAQSIHMAAEIPGAVAGLRALAGAQLTAATAGAALASVMTLGAAAIGITAGFLALKEVIGGVGDAATAGGASLLGYSTAIEAAAARANAAAARFAEVQESLGGSELPTNMDDLQRWLQALDASKRAQQDYIDVVERSGAAFVNQQGINSAVAAKNEAIVRAELEKTTERIRERAAELERARDLPASEITPAEVEARQKAYEADVKYRDQLTGILDSNARDHEAAAERASQAHWAAADASAQAWQSALQGAGGGLERFSSSVLTSLTEAGGALGDYAQRVLEARAAENALLLEAGATSAALVNQATVTRRKGETTEEFVARLEKFYRAEGALTSQVTDSTRAVNLQTKSVEEYGTALNSVGRNLAAAGARLAVPATPLVTTYASAPAAAAPPQSPVSPYAAPPIRPPMEAPALPSSPTPPQSQVSPYAAPPIRPPMEAPAPAATPAPTQVSSPPAVAATPTVAPTGSLLPSWAVDEIVDASRRSHEAIQVRATEILRAAGGAATDAERVRAFERAAREVDPLRDARGRPRLDLASLLNTGPGVDVTAVARGVYATGGGAFTRGGDLGSTDLGRNFGSRTVVHDRGDRGQGAQGGGGVHREGDLNVGGVVVNVYAKGDNRNEVERATRAGVTDGLRQAAVTRTQRRASIRRNV